MKGLKLAAAMIILASLTLTPKAEAKNLLNNQQQPSKSQVIAQANPSQADIYLQEGIDLLNAEKYQEAAEKFTQVLQLDPKNIYAYVCRGMVRLYLEQYQLAKSDFDAALEINSNIAYAYYGRGIVNYLLNNKTAAIADLRTASNLFKQEGKSEMAQKVDNTIEKIQNS